MERRLIPIHRCDLFPPTPYIRGRYYLVRAVLPIVLRTTVDTDKEEGDRKFQLKDLVLHTSGNNLDTTTFDYL